MTVHQVPAPKLSSIQEIVRACGGASRVAHASRGSGREITRDAVFKWYRNGIPEIHWPLVQSLLPDLTVEAIHIANRCTSRHGGMSQALQAHNAGDVAA